MPIQQMLLATGSSSVNLSDNYWMLNYTEGHTTYSMQEGNGVAVNNTDGSVYVCGYHIACLLYTSPSPRDGSISRMPSSA